MVTAAEFGTGQVLWSIFWFFLFFIWIWLLVVVFGDIFRSRDLAGWGKALWTVFVILLILWVLGLVSSYTMGGFIHILLVVAIVMVLINLISGRRTL